MTEKRQTTVERIAAILRQELERAYSVDFGYLGIMGIPAASVRIFYEVVPNAIAAEIDALTRERDEARAQVKEADSGIAALNTQLAEARNGIDALKVEVERLRPAAEAFWAYEVFTATYLREDRDKFAAAAVRARAAKERKP